jgi:hypothetical protein
MAEVVARAHLDPASFKRLEFVVLAPQYSIAKGTFSKELELESIRSKVKKRVDAYVGELDDWYFNHFEPTINCITVKSLSWESALRWISKYKPELDDELHSFYELCLKFK